MRQRPRTLLLEKQQEENVANTRKFPFPTIWVQEEHQRGGGNSMSSRWIRFNCKRKKDFSNVTDRILEAATCTYKWCANFVAPLELCPWTLGSLGTPGAIQIYIVESNSESAAEQVVRAVSLQLQRDVSNGVASPRVAISFCVFVDPWDFDSFYQWFIDLEDGLLDEAEEDPEEIGNYVTIAPFHPLWQFEDQDEALAFEKKSPYPTVSIVCTSEIDKAGPQATQQIGAHNEQLLTKMGASKLKQYYQEHVRVTPTNEDRNMQ